MNTIEDRGKHYLFDSHGRHIAVVMERQLFNCQGRHIGQYLSQYGVFTDLQGRYLGEVVHTDRLLYNLLSPYCTTSFGIQYVSKWRVRPVGEAAQREPIGKIAGHIDISPSQLET